MNKLCQIVFSEYPKYLGKYSHVLDHQGAAEYKGA